MILKVAVVVVFAALVVRSIVTSEEFKRWRRKHRYDGPCNDD
jgi:hypothetical protein